MHQRRTARTKPKKQSAKQKQFYWKKPTLLEQRKEADLARERYHDATKNANTKKQQENDARYVFTRRPKTMMYELVPKKFVRPSIVKYYLPVVRYPGLYYDNESSDKSHDLISFCGMFYYVEPSSTTLLELGSTLITATKAHALRTLVHRIRNLFDETQILEFLGEIEDEAVQLGPDVDFTDQGMDEESFGILSSLLNAAVKESREKFSFPKLSEIEDIVEHVEKKAGKKWIFSVLRRNDKRKEHKFFDAFVTNFERLYTRNFEWIGFQISVQYLFDGVTETMRFQTDEKNDRIRIWNEIDRALYQRVKPILPDLYDTKTIKDEKTNETRQELRIWNEIVQPFFFQILNDEKHVQPIKELGINSLYPCHEQTSKWEPGLGAFDLLDQPICRLAKFLHLDTIVLQREMGEYRAVTEILDTRKDSFQYLIRAVPPLANKNDSWWTPTIPLCETVWFLGNGLLTPDFPRNKKRGLNLKRPLLFRRSTGLVQQWKNIPVPKNLLAKTT